MHHCLGSVLGAGGCANGPGRGRAAAPAGGHQAGSSLAPGPPRLSPRPRAHPPTTTPAPPEAKPSQAKPRRWQTTPASLSEACSTRHLAMRSK